MTTTVDPLGTPSVIYNRGGTAIVEVSPSGSAGTGNAATPIPRVSQLTVALVSTSAGHNDVLLPDDAEIGDAVEVYTLWDGSSVPARVFPNVGEAIGNLATSVGTNLNASLGVGSTGMVFRKVSSVLWVPIGGAA